MSCSSSRQGAYTPIETGTIDKLGEAMGTTGVMVLIVVLVLLVGGGGYGYSRRGS